MPKKKKSKQSPRSKAAPQRAADFTAEQRIKVVRPGDWAEGREGVFKGLSQGRAVIQLDGKQITHEYDLGDVAAA